MRAVRATVSLACLIENYKTSLKEIEDLDEQKDVLCLWTGRLNIVKMSIFQKFIHKFNSILIIATEACFVETDKLTLKFIWKNKGPRKGKYFKKKYRFGGLTLPDFKIYS